MSSASESSTSPLKDLQEDEANQDCMDILPYLPTEKAWISDYFYQYQGFWWPAWPLRGVLAAQTHFQSQDSDIFLVTIPKSGTTWLKAILFALMNRHSYPVTEHHHPLLTKNPHELVPYLELELSAEKKLPDLSSYALTRLFATHLPFVSLPESIKGKACKIVYLCRNPKDTFVSLWQFTKNLRPKNKEAIPLEELFDLFCRGVSMCGPFWDHVLGYWKESVENPQRVFFLKFEEMKEEPTVHVKRLAEFLGYPFSLEEETQCVLDRILSLCSFDNLSNLEVNTKGRLSNGPEKRLFFRRGEVGDWVNYLTVEMADRLDRITEEKLHGSGLKL